jgi:DNA replication protein DnaC
VPVNRIHEPTDADIAENAARRQQMGYAPNPLCSVCHGAGFVNPLTLDGRVDYSKYVICPAPDCLADSKQHYRETGEYLELKGVSSRLQTFSAFKVRQGTEKAVRAFHDLTRGNTDKAFLLCYGGNGCGKTHLCQALTSELDKRGIDAHYYSVPALMRTLRESISTNNTDEWVKSLTLMGGLILDDYGLGRESDWTEGCLEEIIDARWQEKRITVLTTNRDLAELSPRIRSRFSDAEMSVIVHISANDYRPVKREG